MKTKLNLICVMVFCLMVADLWGGWFEFDVGKNAADYEMETQQEARQAFRQQKVTDAWMVNLLPISKVQTAIMVRNELTGKMMRAWPTAMYVEPETPEEFSGWHAFLESVFALLALAGMLMTIVVFVWFIGRVNHNYIFDRKNVTLLRLAGTGLLTYGIIGTVWNILAQVDTVKQFQLSGYGNDWLSGIEFTTLLLGLIAFVAAQVFAMGVKMKEEQELTI